MAHHPILRLALMLLAALLPLQAGAQTPKFGYLSYREAVKAMPEYADVQRQLASLRKQYDDEAKRSEDEFNDKYEQFLEMRKELAEPILKKWQAELEDLLARNVSFKNEARRLLRQARADMYATLEKRLDAILASIGEKRGYAFILNTDGHALPFANAACGEDLSGAVREAVAAETRGRAGSSAAPGEADGYGYGDNGAGDVDDDTAGTADDTIDPPAHGGPQAP